MNYVNCYAFWAQDETLAKIQMKIALESACIDAREGFSDPAEKLKWAKISGSIVRD